MVLADGHWSWFDAVGPGLWTWVTWVTVHTVPYSVLYFKEAMVSDNQHGQTGQGHLCDIAPHGPNGPHGRGQGTTLHGPRGCNL